MINKPVESDVNTQIKGKLKRPENMKTKKVETDI